MINPCVIIATHERLSITTTNIKLLLDQGVKIVLVVSDTREKEYYENFDIHVVLHANHPLGAKWQFGVDKARQFDPSHIVITGSDDLLSKYFFERYCNEWDLVGFKSWYIWNKEKLHLLDYITKQPLGGGRVYSKFSLEYLDYKLFDITKNKWLDDYAWEKVSFAWRMQHNPEILAVKGNWPCMNPVDLKHRNVKLIATYQGEEALKIMKEKFNYIP